MLISRFRMTLFLNLKVYMRILAKRGHSIQKKKMTSSTFSKYNIHKLRIRVNALCKFLEQTEVENSSL